MAVKTVKATNSVLFNKKAAKLVDYKVRDMPKRHVFTVLDPTKDSFSALCLMLIREMEETVKNVKELNNKISYQDLKMEGFFLLKEMLLLNEENK